MGRNRRSDGRYQARLYTGMEHGKARYRYIYARTKRELDAKLKELRRSTVRNEGDTFGTWRQKWLEMKRSAVSAARYAAYKSLAAKLLPLDAMPIASVRAEDIQKLLGQCIGLSCNTLLGLKCTVRQIFRYALRSRVIDVDPTEGIRIPVNAQKPLRRSLSASERHMIADTPDGMQLPAMIMMYAGLRRGELVALRWTDIDLAKRTITVCRSAEVVHGRFAVKPMTKSRAGMRTVYIPKLLADYLMEQEHAADELVYPVTYAREWDRRWAAYLDRLNEKYDAVPHFTAHWLRHTFITLMYLSGVDVLTAKEQAGHASVQTTMGIYTHLDTRFKAKNVEKLDIFLCENDRVSEWVSDGESGAGGNAGK